MADQHVATDTYQVMQGKGCTCEFGCRNCGMNVYQMSNCPAWSPCPVGRAPNSACPLSAEREAE